MSNSNLVDAAKMGEAPKKSKWKKMSNVGGEKGKLHREMGIKEGEKIPKDKLAAAAHSAAPEKKRDAVRAQTMAKWHHGKHSTAETAKKRYGG